MKGKTDEEIGAIAADYARLETQRLLKKNGPSLKKILRKLNESLDAKEQKVHYDKKSGIFRYSNKLIDHGTRIRAVRLAVELWDAMPAQKHDVVVKETPKFEAVVDMIQKAKNDG